ncbi:MAG: EamA family transporter [Candidatus Harrisonbacteria bacterium]|nr:EamA family transporter [Candidatus Harrisonbacteria bacterium]
MTSSVIFLIALTIGLGTASKVLHRYVLKETEPYAYALLTQAVAALFFLPLALKNFVLPSGTPAWSALLLASLFWTGTAVAKYTAYKGTEVSLKEPLDQSKLILALLLGVVVLGETPSLARIIGTIVIFLGVSILLFHPEKKFGRLTDPGVQWTLGSAMLGTITAVIDKFALGYFTPEIYGLLVYIGPLLTLLLFLPKRAVHVGHLLRQRPWSALSGVLLATAAYYTLLNVYAVADFTLAYPLLQLGTLLTVLSGILIFKEREHLLQKIVATAIIVTGSILVRF